AEIGVPGIARGPIWGGVLCRVPWFWRHEGLSVQVTISVTVTIGEPQARHQTPVARATGLSKVYGSGQAQVTALDAVDVAFGGGQFAAIMGPSGSGKSTLMHCLAGLDAPTSGQVWIGDTQIGALRDKKLTELRREAIGFVFQSFNLIPTLTAAENIVLPMTLAGTKPDQVWLDQVIDTVDLRPRL